MFLDLYQTLRGLRVPVSLTEWLTLLEGLSKGLHNDSLADFYYMARSLLVKDVAHYDAFDQAFCHCFKDAPLPDDATVRGQVLEWLQDPHAPQPLSKDEAALLEVLTLEELLRELEKRLRTQDGPHDQGQEWIGTGGTSPFGSGGSHPSGISFDADGGGGRAALQAFGRRYRNLRNDLTLDVRQMGVALKRLRDLRESGAEEVLDLEATIDRTCRNAGEIDLVFARERENQVRLLLVMDSGGSMEPFRALSERLFSAAHGLNYFKDFRALYFHNCVYENLYTDLDAHEFMSTDKVVREYGRNYRLVVVGDAAMSLHELQSPHGTLERYRTSEVTGLERLRQLSQAFPRRAWLNPLPENSWVHYDTVSIVEKLFPMFPLTLEGLTQAVRQLR
jgi:uncharacterized protein with von Willebrand factor type A (vWA) domain